MAKILLPNGHIIECEVFEHSEKSTIQFKGHIIEVVLVTNIIFDAIVPHSWTKDLDWWDDGNGVCVIPLDVFMSGYTQGIRSAKNIQAWMEGQHKEAT